MNCSKNYLVCMALAIAGTASQAATFVYNGPDVPIPDGSDMTGDAPGAQVGAPIAVTGLSGLVSSVSIRIGGTECSTVVGSNTVGIAHTYVGDLVLTLRSPSGAEVIVINEAGGSGNNFCQVILQDGAANSIQDVNSENAPFAGIWSPANALSTFQGEAPNGDWTLLVQDFSSQDSGSIRDWSIDLSVAPPVSTTVAPVPVADVPALILSGFGIVALTAWLRRSRKRQQA